jgi:Tfp pilus assembly PilM family ATPase
MTKSKTIISLHDNKIQYLTLAKNEYGFYVENYDSAELSDGIMKNGEILKAEFLSKILSKIQKKNKYKTHTSCVTA